jgi:hypothetical protein
MTGNVFQLAERRRRHEILAALDEAWARRERELEEREREMRPMGLICPPRLRVVPAGSPAISPHPDR